MLLLPDHGPDTVVGEKLEENGVGKTAVDNVNRFDSLFQGVEAGFDFGNHTAGNRAGLDHFVNSI